jgi:hypothetical protein
MMPQSMHRHASKHTTPDSSTLGPVSTLQHNHPTATAKKHYSHITKATRTDDTATLN